MYVTQAIFYDTSSMLKINTPPFFFFDLNSFKTISDLNFWNISRSKNHIFGYFQKKFPIIFHIYIYKIYIYIRLYGTYYTMAFILSPCMFILCPQGDHDWQINNFIYDTLKLKRTHFHKNQGKCIHNQFIIHYFIQ